MNNYPPLNSDSCWVCRRTKSDLAQDEIMLETGQVQYEVKSADQIRNISVCAVCLQLLKIHGIMKLS